jgi:predicted nucleic acid-binding protein
MSFILDTCVVLELTRQKPDVNVFDWFKRCDEDLIYISCLTMGELRYGIDILPEGKKKNDLVMWFNNFDESYKEFILPVTGSISKRWGKERAKYKKMGFQLPVIDGLIGCTAIEYNYTLVTRNVVDYEKMDIQLLNPWE